MKNSGIVTRLKGKIWIPVVLMAGSLLVGCSIDGIVEDNSDYTADMMETTTEDNKEFYIMRVKDDYLEVLNGCKLVYTGDGEYPDLEDGQIARVIADVTIYNGGIAGFWNDPFIDDIKECEIITYDTFVTDYSISQLYKDVINYNSILQYQDEDDVYLIVQNAGYIEVYKNSKPFMEYKESEYEDKLEPVKEFFDQKYSSENIVAIEGYEYEILDDAHFSGNIKERGYIVESGDTPDSPYYFTIYSGEKHTGGYDIRIKEISVQDDGAVVVKIDETAPEPGDIVTEAFTYPSCSFSISPYPENVYILDELENLFERL